LAVENCCWEGELEISLKDFVGHSENGIRESTNHFLNAKHCFKLDFKKCSNPLAFCHWTEQVKFCLKMAYQTLE
jgi:hypothetical protein